MIVQPDHIRFINQTRSRAIDARACPIYTNLLESVRVLEATHSRGVVVGKVESGSTAVQGLHAVGVSSTQARPVHGTHAQRTNGVCIGLYVSDLVAAIDRAVVVESRRHRS